MKLPLFIACRYLFSRKKHNAVNIISIVSACGVAVATMALICTLSVFNGFRGMVEQLFTAFDPALKVQPVRGKVFSMQDERIRQVRLLPGVALAVPTLEEEAMVSYKERQMVVTLKGVGPQFEELSGFAGILRGNTHPVLSDSLADYGIPGAELTMLLSTGPEFVDPIQVYLPIRTARVNPANPATAFTTGTLHSPGAVFAVNQSQYDARYIITSLAFMRRLLRYTDEASALEIKPAPGTDLKQLQQHISHLLGTDFTVKNRYQQQAEVFKIMEIEKLLSYIFLSFILLVAGFNVISSLSMLMLEKKEHVQTLRVLGADQRLVGRIFLLQGWLISVLGAVVGLLAGVVLCLLQQHLGLIKLGSDSSLFIMDAYPVQLQMADVLGVFATVVLIGLGVVSLPVQKMSRHLGETYNNRI